MNRLKELRKERELRQKDVAEKLGISAQSLGYYENGVNKPDPDMLCKLADFYEVSLDYLLCRTDDSGVICKCEGVRLGKDEEELLKTYRSLPVGLKILAKNTLSSWNDLDPKHFK